MARAQLIGFLLALIGTAGLTPLFSAFSRRFGVLDLPDPRKVHSHPIPRWVAAPWRQGFSFRWAGSPGLTRGSVRCWLSGTRFKKAARLSAC